MATLTLGGRVYEIAPFRLRELRLAAPHIDRLAARQGPPGSVAAVAEAAADMLAVLAAGLPGVAGEELQAAASLDDLEGLRSTFDTVMAEAGTIGAGATQTLFASALDQPAGWFSLGKVAFTGGANAGATVTVKLYDGQGGFQLVAPLQEAPAEGDGFVAYPGCALSMADCQGKFANLARFRGQPFIPQPSTGLPT